MYWNQAAMQREVGWKNEVIGKNEKENWLRWENSKSVKIEQQVGR